MLPISLHIELLTNIQGIGCQRAEFPSFYRDAMHVVCCCPVSVRQSVTLVHGIQTAEDIVELLSLPGSPIIVVF